MGSPVFHQSKVLQDFVARTIGSEHVDLEELEFAHCERAGFVETDVPDLTQGFEVGSSLDQHPVLSGRCESGNVRNRSGDDECTRTRNDHQGQAAAGPVSTDGRTPQPGKGAHGECRDHHNGCIDLGKGIHDFLRLGTVCLRLLHEANEARDGRVIAGASGLHHDLGFPGVDGAAGHFVLGPLHHGPRFPGQGGLVHGRGSLYDDAVAGYLVPALDCHHGSHRNRSCRNHDELLRLGLDDVGTVRFELDDGGQGGIGPAGCPVFQPFGERKQKGHGSGLVVFLEADGTKHREKHQHVRIDHPTAGRS
mmetsp:Transcript_6102/g.17310  ORF Transcript_6102/g.17310 Transcript_6102/m.17310 type:complete len:307 (-) Transcript_6102:968-1888(-)